MRYAHRLLVAGLISLAATSAFAQQQPDPVFLQKALASLQSQRNAALDNAAALDAKVAMLVEENAALKKQIEDLTKKTDAPK